MDSERIVAHVSTLAYDKGKEVKRRRINSLGTNMYLNSDGSVSDELKCIVNCQRIFKHEYYKPDGIWAKKMSDVYAQKHKEDTFTNHG
jgi:hypothetical protein